VKKENITPEEAMQALEGEVKVYDQYLRGQVWGFIVENECDKCEQTTDTEDSCFGFIGDELEETGIEDHLDDSVKSQLETAWEARS
jgi:GTPase involved in cell partitioning and DNA repair